MVVNQRCERGDTELKQVSDSKRLVTSFGSLNSGLESARSSPVGITSTCSTSKFWPSHAKWRADWTSKQRIVLSSLLQPSAKSTSLATMSRQCSTHLSLPWRRI